MITLIDKPHIRSAPWWGLFLLFLQLTLSACKGTTDAAPDDPVLVGEWEGRRYDLRLDYRYTLRIEDERPSVGGLSTLHVLYTGTEREILGSPTTTTIKGHFNPPEVVLELNGGMFVGELSSDERSIGGFVYFIDNPKSQLTLTRKK